MSEKENLDLQPEENNEELDNNSENSSEEQDEQLGFDIDNALVYDGEENRDIREDMEEGYLSYAMSVIISRALPDVRD
jgi:DNA gyrase subunit A